MAPRTKGGTGFDPAAIEAVEWLARRDLGAPAPGSGPESVAEDWRDGGFGDDGHWRRYLRGPHPPRFRRPGGVEVNAVGPDDDAESFGATAAFGLRLPARVGAALASLPGRPGWRCYVAHGGSAPAAAATFASGSIVLLVVDASAEAGGRSAARAALLHQVLADAIETGARTIGARVDESGDSRHDDAAGLLLAGFEAAYLCPAWVDARLPAG